MAVQRLNLNEKRKASLMQELGKSSIGRMLLDFTKAHDIKIHLVDSLEGNRLGEYRSGERAVYLLGMMTIVPQLLFLAHEIRHAAQHVLADGALESTFMENSPFNTLMRSWVKEMDADAFGAYFIYAHSQECGFDYYSCIRRDSTGANGDPRPMVYAGFDKGLQHKDTQRLSIALREALIGFVKNAPLRDSYYNDNLSDWYKYTLAYLKEHCSEYRQHGQTLALQARKPVHGRDLLRARVRGYSRLFNHAGMPDYLAGTPIDWVEDKIRQETILTPQQASALRDAMYDFNKVADDYGRLRIFSEIPKDSFMDKIRATLHPLRPQLRLAVQKRA